MKNETHRIEKGNRAFKMLKILREKDGELVKSREIMQRLGLTETRSIRIYKKILIDLGYNIRTKGGYRGGYSLIEERLSAIEIEQLKRLVKDENLLQKILRINNRI